MYSIKMSYRNQDVNISGDEKICEFEKIEKKVKRLEKKGCVNEKGKKEGRKRKRKKRREKREKRKGGKRREEEKDKRQNLTQE
ncbi:6-carboxyhexanoate--CoA ligase, partial [Staphylococcus aureus]